MTLIRFASDLCAWQSQKSICPNGSSWALYRFADIFRHSWQEGAGGEGAEGWQLRQEEWTFPCKTPKLLKGRNKNMTCFLLATSAHVFCPQRSSNIWFLPRFALGKGFPLLCVSGGLPSRTAKAWSHQQTDHFLSAWTMQRYFLHHIAWKSVDLFPPRQGLFCLTGYKNK